MKAAFFDRDGTLIKDVEYLSSFEAIEFIEKAIQFALACQQNGYSVFIVTNQSGIARGFFSEQFVQQTHAILKERLSDHGIFVRDFYYCPHHPIHSVVPELKKACVCRKPAPGMLLQAADEHDIELDKSLMFGDKEIDRQAGLAAGCRSFLIHQVLAMSCDQWNKEIFNPIQNDSDREGVSW